jgi:ankyrin repeat protein
VFDVGRAFTLAAANGHVKVMQILMLVALAGNAAIRDEMRSGRALMGAARGGHAECVLELLAANLGWAAEVGVGMDAHDKDGWTPLMAACDQKYEEIVAFLLDEGADPEVADTTGYTPLMAAVCADYIEAVELLLEMGASAEAVDHDGWTAMMFAADAGHAHIVQLLTQVGARRDEVNHDGQSAVDLAVQGGHLAALHAFVTEAEEEEEKEEGEEKGMVKVDG